MTTNQTIDGVPRRMLAALLCHVSELENRALVDELRALLYATDAGISASPAAPKPTGLSQGWNLTRKHDGFVVGHQSVAYPPDEKDIQRAERGSYVWVPFLLPAAQPQGEPVDNPNYGCPTCGLPTAHHILKFSEDLRKIQPQGETVTIEAVAVTRDNGDGCLRLEWLLEGGIAQMEAAGMMLFAIPEANDLCDEDGSVEVYLTPPQVEQSAPVAVVLPERREPKHYWDRFGKMTAIARVASEEWNAYLDELKRLNPSL